MTPREAVILTRYVKALCPQQAIDEYTPDAWHDVLGDLGLPEARAAAATVAGRQPFVAPSEILAEANRAHRAELGRQRLAALEAGGTLAKAGGGVIVTTMPTRQINAPDQPQPASTSTQPGDQDSNHG